MVPKICSVPECGRKFYCKSFCVTHYQRWRKHGDINKGRPSEAERYWSKVEKTQSCWNWKAAIDVGGYGIFGQRKAHRVSYEWANGAVDSGTDIDHICHNRRCVNPAHLRQATRKQNVENHSGAYRNSKSGVRGVFWHPGTKKWRAVVRHNGKKIQVGMFMSLPDAEAAVIAKRNELFTHNDRDRIAL